MYISIYFFFIATKCKVNFCKLTLLKKQTMGNVFLILGVIIFILLLFGTFFIVKQQSAGVVERFGRFTSIRKSGLQMKIHIIDRVVGRVNLRVQQLDVILETKTKEDVFVKLKMSVQFKVIEENVYNAFFNLQHPYYQITCYIFYVVRAPVQKLWLDYVFLRKHYIANAVKKGPNHAMTR